MTTYYLWFFLFAIIIYLAIRDSNVLQAIDLIFKLTQVYYERIKWLIVNNPSNPIVKYMIWRRSLRLAKELHEELVNSKKMPYNESVIEDSDHEQNLS